MEMGDYRYFFEPLKVELDAVLEKPLESIETSRILPLKRNISQNDNLQSWTVEDIRSLIEFWFLSGYGHGLSDIDDLLKADWSDSDIEYWELVFSTFHHSPNLIINAMKDKLLIGHADIHGLSSAQEYFDSLDGARNRVKQD